MKQICLLAISLMIVTSISSLKKPTIFPYTCTKADRNRDCECAKHRTVCGWFDQTIQCVRYPCAITSNSICEACLNEHVFEVTDGDCESQAQLESSISTETDIEKIKSKAKKIIQDSKDAAMAKLRAKGLIK